MRTNDYGHTCFCHGGRSMISLCRDQHMSPFAVAGWKHVDFINRYVLTVPQFLALPSMGQATMDELDAESDRMEFGRYS